MNIYIVVEGERASKRLYKNWIPFVNDNLQPIDYPQNVIQDHFYLLAGHGQPGIWDRVRRGVEDVNRIEAYDRLVIALDSEEKSFEEMKSELNDRVSELSCRVEIKYIIQHFCLETWLLGNYQLFRRKPRNDDLIRYKAIFDVRTEDPEDLPANHDENLNRSKFAYNYLRAAIRDIHGDRFKIRKSYNKRNPGLAAGQGFYYQVKKRFSDKNHIQSFITFLEAFI